MKHQTLGDYIHAMERHERQLVDHAPCHCFPGTCRGGEVIDGRLANGLRCKAQIPFPIKPTV